MKEALKLALEALEYFSDTATLNMDKAFSEDAIAAIKEALAQPEQDKERCVGCEACIDTACGRDECPKGWPKAAQPEQEPVAWMYPDALCDRSCLYVCTKAFTQFPECANTPPQRTWVGLTDEEKQQIMWTFTGHTGLFKHFKYMEAVEAKLKEKNT